MDNIKPIKLHLGCQEKYLDGYINIDLPPEEHTAEKVKADVYADVRNLKYEPDSVQEIRSHHLLEHFSRQEALLLLARWHKWLKVGGLLVAETPDFEESAGKFMNGKNIDDKFALARHIFGSHEAQWAYHKDFWSEEKFRYVLASLGFGNFRFEKSSNNLEQKMPFFKNKLGIAGERVMSKLGKLGFNILPNIVCYAEKTRETANYGTIIKEILKKSLVGREAKILDVWMDDIAGKI